MSEPTREELAKREVSEALYRLWVALANNGLLMGRDEAEVVLERGDFVKLLRIIKGKADPLAMSWAIASREEPSWPAVEQWEFAPPPSVEWCRLKFSWRRS